MPIRRRLPEEQAAPLRDRIRSAVTLRDGAQELLDNAVRDGLSSGLAYNEVAELIGMSKPTVFNRYGTLSQIEERRGRG